MFFPLDGGEHLRKDVNNMANGFVVGKCISGTDDSSEKLLALQYRKEKKLILQYNSSVCFIIIRAKQ